MGDRICIRLTDGEESTPTFYGHWCGLRGLKVMNETLKEPANSMGGYMCNFIVKIMGGEPQKYSFDIWNDGEGNDAADWDWGTWTYHFRTSTWTTTYSKLRDRSMTESEVDEFVKSIRPCLYRECECEHYGEESCWKYYYERHVEPLEKRLQQDSR